MSNQFISTLQQWRMIHPFARRGIYLSGPISAAIATAPERFQKAKDFMQEVFGRMQVVATPMGIDLPNCAVPGAIFDHAAFSHPLYMSECYTREANCSCIALLPGWHKSKGAVYEARFAESLGIVPLFLHPSTDGDGLFADLSETFRFLQRAEWVDLAISETEFGYVGDILPEHDHGPNPRNAPGGNAVAVAIADALKPAASNGGGDTERWHDGVR